MSINPFTGLPEFTGDQVEVGQFHTIMDDKNPNPAHTTTSTSFVTLNSSNVIVFSGRPVLVLLKGSGFFDIGPDQVDFAIQVDGGSDVPLGSAFHNTSAIHAAFNGMAVIQPTPGSHTLNLRWKVTGNTFNINIDDHVECFAIEL